MEDLNGYFAVHSQGLGHASRAIALARGLTARRPDIGLLFLAGSPALDLVVSNGFDALTFPSVPDWPERDGSLDPVWRWYAEYARYLRLARRFLRKEADWRFNRFLISDGEIASVREAIRHGVPTAMVLHTVRHDFARDAISPQPMRSAMILAPYRRAAFTASAIVASSLTASTVIPSAPAFAAISTS